MTAAFLKQFLSFIEENDLFHRKEDKILLTVSGGVDSVVMAIAFAETGLKFGIAHCNFGLRGAESDGDEAFVKALAEKLEVSFFVKRFDTKLFAGTNKLSTQMAARELRYNWFEEIRKEHNYNYIATAHHKNDVAETILLNLVKGTVLKGLHGIKPRNNTIIRPLLWAEKVEILQFANEQKIKFREDSSNIENKYQRNLIRNEIIPLLKKINPEVVNTLCQNAQPRLQIEEWLGNQAKELFYKLFKKEENGIFKCSVDELKKAGINEAVFYQMLEDFGFSYSQIKDLFRLLDETEHKRFHSSAYRLIKERNEIIITPLNMEKNQQDTEISFLIKNENTIAEFNGRNLSISTITPEEIAGLKNPDLAFLDVSKLTFPLKIRRLQKGDYFYPIGMKGKKKLSDYFTDIKLSALEKEKQLLLISGDDIAWIIGKRIDARFAVTESTRQVLKLAFE